MSDDYMIDIDDPASIPRDRIDTLQQIAGCEVHEGEAAWENGPMKPTLHVQFTDGRDSESGLGVVAGLLGMKPSDPRLRLHRFRPPRDS